MLDIRLIRQNPELVRTSLEDRGDNPSAVDAALEMDSQRRKLLEVVEALKAERNLASEEISRIQAPLLREERVAEMRALGVRITALDKELTIVNAGIKGLMDRIPNLPDPQTPRGADERENFVIRSAGEILDPGFQPRPHWEIGRNLEIIDFDRGVKMSGSRFYVLSGAGARLQRALISWMLDLHIRQGYLEKYLPFMVTGPTVYSAGQLPKFSGNLYKDHEEDLYFVPTAEVPLTGLHMGETLDEDTLPRCYTAYTPCFRREKMSAGRDVRGIKRGHQFDKVEMYIYSRPEESWAMLQKMVKDAEETCAGLGLAYRIKQLCTGDLGFHAAMTYDLEVWAPGCGEWLEVSSVSNVGDFQARRAEIKYRPSTGGKPRLLHTLNGSGLGIPRTLISVLETYQQADGSVIVPDVLRPWMGGVEVIRPRGQDPQTAGS